MWSYFCYIDDNYNILFLILYSYWLRISSLFWMHWGRKLFYNCRKSIKLIDIQGSMLKQWFCKSQNNLPFALCLFKLMLRYVLPQKKNYWKFTNLIGKHVVLFTNFIGKQRTMLYSNRYWKFVFGQS